MNTPDQQPNDDLILITREQAMSSRVDDFLRRQMSLRGETGVQRDRRRWYYQNWFVFGLVGMVAAVVAWALLEPSFDDQFYIQGTVKLVSAQVPDLGLAGPDGQRLDLSGEAVGSIRINDELIVILRRARDLRPDGSRTGFDLGGVKVGDTIGLWVDAIEVERGFVGLSRLVVTQPAKNPPAKASLSLSRLESRSNAAGLFLFPLVAGLIGLGIGAADGIICRIPSRAFLAGFVGLLVGLVGGFLSSVVAGLVYTPLNRLANSQADFGHGLTILGFFIQMTGRGIAWALAGLTMGLGQGLALRSKRLLVYGLIGGVMGGLAGGLLFDPIDLLLLGADKPSAHWSRLVGLGIIGAAVGALIGVVELLARDAWLRMTQGPLAGKEFLIFKDVMTLGSSPRSDIYLFNDTAVAPHHATIRMVGGEAEVESRDRSSLVLVNGRPVGVLRLRHGDQIGLGRTTFTFEKRQG